MAVFGAPLEQPDHADRALAAARAMAGQRLEAFNAWLRGERLGAGFRIGIGLNTGSVMSGNVGSQRRLGYAAIGDTTNTAARLEDMTKEHAVAVLLSEATREALRADPGDLRRVGAAVVRGRRAPLELWTLDAGRRRAGRPRRLTGPQTGGRIQRRRASAEQKEAPCW